MQTLVLCDLDKFKLINDRHGHPKDEVLRAVGAILAGSIRDRDSAARYGGEELALILPGTPLLGARRLSERIRRKLEELEIEAETGERIAVTASFGAAFVPDACDGRGPCCRGGPGALRGEERRPEPRHDGDGPEEARAARAGAQFVSTITISATP